MAESDHRDLTHIKRYIPNRRYQNVLATLAAVRNRDRLEISL